jgi:hypothetical protein
LIFGLAKARDQAEDRDAQEQVALDHAQRAGQHVLRVLQVQGGADQGEADGGDQQQGVLRELGSA